MYRPISGLTLLALCHLHLAACDGRPYGDAGPEGDAGPGADSGPIVDDGGMEDGGGEMIDGGPPPPTGSEPTPPAEVVSTGSGGFLLRGTVLGPDGIIDPGEVLIVGNTITCVAADCSGEAEAATVTVIETMGVISPGLIDAHNHLTYDFLPEWVATETYDNRYTWADVASYEDHIAPFADGRNQSDRVCPSAQWGELRSIIHGTTTVQGQSFNRTCLQRHARNADHHHGLPNAHDGDSYDHMQTTISTVRDITDEAAATLVSNFTDPTSPTTRYGVHMQEGVGGGYLLEEFESFAGRDTRSNRHMGISLLAEEGMFSGVGLLIHSMGLTTAQLMEVVDTDAHVVWSPSSNMVLYGETAPIEEMLSLGVSVGLGPDWTVSGEDEMLSEMRFAYDYGQAEDIDALTPERIWRMATEGSADAVGLVDHIGRLEVGARGDVTVFGRRGADPYRAVLDSRAQDVRLVLIDGAAYYGDLALEVATSVNGECDMLDACGSMKFLCVANTPGSFEENARADETLDDIRAQLEAILDMYGRASELQELIVCE